MEPFAIEKCQAEKAKRNCLLDHFIHVFEPHVSVHVIKIGAHGEHDVIGCITTGLFLGVVD